MELDRLREWIRQGESERLELKRSIASLESAGKALCGMLNVGGGDVVIGVDPDGQLVGQEVSDETERKIAQFLRKFEPPGSVDVRRVPVAEKRELIILRANPDPRAIPYVFDGRPYIRVRSTTQRMGQAEYNELLQARQQTHARWENQPARGVSIDELDLAEVVRVAKRGAEVGRLPDVAGLAARDILERLSLVENGQPLNAAVVLFGTKFLPRYPQCELRMARFKGIDKTEFLDQRQVQGHVFSLLEEAMLFLRRHLPVAGRVLPGLFERKDEPLFPLVALREALVNALCHRDYTVPGGAVSLAVFDDRLEIWSAGTLPFGLSPADLKRDHPSRPRNPLIADVLYRCGLIERWGRGTQKIVQLCLDAGHPEPEFGEQAGAVWVRFLVSGYTAPHRVAADLTERQRTLLQVLSTAPELPLREIRLAFDGRVADRTIRQDLAHLRRLGLVRVRGHGRGAFWALRRDGESDKPDNNAE